MSRTQLLLCDPRLGVVRGACLIAGQRGSDGAGEVEARRVARPLGLRGQCAAAGRRRVGQGQRQAVDRCVRGGRGVGACQGALSRRDRPRLAGRLAERVEPLLLEGVRVASLVVGRLGGELADRIGHARYGAVRVVVDVLVDGWRRTGRAVVLRGLPVQGVVGVADRGALGVGRGEDVAVDVVGLGAGARVGVGGRGDLAEQVVGGVPLLARGTDVRALAPVVVGVVGGLGGSARDRHRRDAVRHAGGDARRGGVVVEFGGPAQCVGDSRGRGASCRAGPW